MIVGVAVGQGAIVHGCEDLATIAGVRCALSGAVADVVDLVDAASDVERGRIREL